MDPGKFKISYVALIKDFDWVIGTGTYLGEVDGLLQHFDNAISLAQQDLIETFFIIFGILAAGFFSMLLITRKLIKFHTYEKVARKLHTHVQQDLGYLVHNFDKVLTGPTDEYDYLRIERNFLTEQNKKIKHALKNCVVISKGENPYNQTLNDELIAFKKELEEEEHIPIQFLASENAINKSRNLPRAKKEVLLDVATQALQNIAQYSAATNIVIQLEVRERNLILMISDNGIGFNIEEVDTNKSRGLSDMKKAMEDVGGKLEIISSVSEFEVGTQIIATLPIRQRIRDYFNNFFEIFK